MARRFKRSNNRREDTRSLFRTNRQIRALEVRVVGNNLGEISKKYGQPVEPGIYPTRQAVAIAEAVEMDLVEISPKAKPPVVRIVDFSKFLYEKKKKEKEIKAKAVKTVVKEIRFGPNTDEHDFQFKVKHAQNFLEDGAKVKAYVQFKGRTIVFKERGKLLLLKFLAELDAYGSAEALPKMEGRRMFVFVAPKKIKKKVTTKSKNKKPKAPKEAKATTEVKDVKAATEVKEVKAAIKVKEADKPVKE